jgi:hypothetical protein
VNPAARLLLAGALACLSLPARAGTAPEVPSSPKGPEITTVGSAPAVLTAAHRAKLVEVLRQAELRRAMESARTRSAARPGQGTLLPAPPKAPFFETVRPAVGARNRFKEVPPPAAPASVPLAPPATPKVKAAGKETQP